MIKNFLDELLATFSQHKSEVVYVAVTPSVGIEVIQVDPAVKAVKNYAFKPLEYNEGMREIAHYDDFRNKLEQLFTELNIGRGAQVVLSLPTVHLGKLEFPTTLSEGGIELATTTDAERSYIFKKKEPEVTWFKAQKQDSSDTCTIIYSAIQKSVIESVKNVINSLGATLIGLEPSIMSILEALSFTNSAASEMNGNQRWNLLLINSNGYSIVSLEGKDIVNYYDEPLALKTYEVDEIYDVISASLEISLVERPAESLYIVSETDLVSAEHLSTVVKFDGNVSYLENNSFKKNELLQITLNVLPEHALKISLEAIGIAVSSVVGVYPVHVDFLKDKKIAQAQEESYILIIKHHSFLVTETALKKIVMILAIILIVPSLLAMGILPVLTKRQQTKLDTITEELTKVEDEIRDISGRASNKNAFVIAHEIERVVKGNRIKLIAYSALGESVPSDLWIESFVAKDDGKVDITGFSNNVKSIYSFFSNMKYAWINSQLRLQKLEMHAGTIDNVVSSSQDMSYEFEITNINEPSKDTPADANNAQQNANSADAANSQNPPVGDDMQNNQEGPVSDEGQPAGEKKSTDNLKQLFKPVNQLEPVDIGK